MSSRLLVTAVAAALTLAVGGSGGMLRAADRDSDADEVRARVGPHQEKLGAALKDLRQARRALLNTVADPKHSRGKAIEQTQYAIEQVFAALGDDAGKAADQERYTKQRDNAMKNPNRAEDTDQNLRTALDHLRSAKKNLTDAGSAGTSYQPKALEFVNQAIRDVQTQVNATGDTQR
jgi:hypothetical protein